MSNNKNYTQFSIETTQRYSLTEFCAICDTHTDLIIKMVSHGIIEPHGQQPQSWQFDEVALQRSQTALRLQNDLGINLSGLALALDLLEQVSTLRAEINQLEQQMKCFTS